MLKETSQTHSIILFISSFRRGKIIFSDRSQNNGHLGVVRREDDEGWESVVRELKGLIERF